MLVAIDHLELAQAGIDYKLDVILAGDLLQACVGQGSRQHDANRRAQIARERGQGLDD